MVTRNDTAMAQKVRTYQKILKKLLPQKEFAQYCRAIKNVVKHGLADTPDAWIHIHGHRFWALSFNRVVPKPRFPNPGTVIVQTRLISRCFFAPCNDHDQIEIYHRGYAPSEEVLVVLASLKVELSRLDEMDLGCGTLTLSNDLHDEDDSVNLLEKFKTKLRHSRDSV